MSMQAAVHVYEAWIESSIQMSDVCSEGAVGVSWMCCSNEFGYIARPIASFGHFHQLLSAHYKTQTQLHQTSHTCKGK